MAVLRLGIRGKTRCVYAGGNVEDTAGRGQLLAPSATWGPLLNAALQVYESSFKRAPQSLLGRLLDLARGLVGLPPGRPSSLDWIEITDGEYQLAWIVVESPEDFEARIARHPLRPKLLTRDDRPFMPEKRTKFEAEEAKVLADFEALGATGTTTAAADDPLLECVNASA